MLNVVIVQELEDRRKIKDLLQLTRPVTQEVTYFKDCRPDQMTRHVMVTKTAKRQHIPKPSQHQQHTDDGEICMEDQISKSSSSVHSVTKGTQKSGSIRNSINLSSTSNNRRKQTGEQPSRVLRTVFLPNEKTDALVLQLESLKAQMEEKTRLSTEKEQLLINERKVKIEEEKLRSERDKQTIEQLQTELQRVDNLLSKTTKEYFVVNHNLKISDRTYREQVELLKAENANLLKQTELLKAKSKREAKVILHTAREESEEFAKHFRQQAIARENDVLSLQDQLNNNKEKYQVKMTHMEKKLNAFETKYKNLSSRRAVDLEGFNTDVTLLRKHIQKLEGRLSRTIALCMPPQNSSEVIQVQNTRDSLASQLASLKEKLSNVEKDIRRGRVNLSRD
jgi:DNA repair exonuclease SbcCD ATPase subunit